MSAYSKTPTEFKDGDLLIKALEDMGYHPVNALLSPRPLVGFQGDFRRADDPEKHTTLPSEALKAHIILTRKEVGGMSNEIGFERGPDGRFQAILSDYDRGRGFNEKWVKKVNVAYQHLHLNKQAQKLGYRVVVNGQKRDNNSNILDYQFVKA